MARIIDVEKKVDEYKRIVHRDRYADFMFDEMYAIGEYCNLTKKGPIDLWHTVMTALAFGFIKGRNYERRQQKAMQKRKKNEK